LRESNFETANLRGTSLTGAQLAKADLNGADLSNSRLSRADLSGTSLETSNLSAARVSGSAFNQANVKAANLIATGLNKKFALSEFPDLEFSDQTTWDQEYYRRNKISLSHAQTIEKEAKKKSFFSRLFS